VGGGLIQEKREKNIASSLIKEKKRFIVSFSWGCGGKNPRFREKKKKKKWIVFGGNTPTGREKQTTRERYKGQKKGSPNLSRKREGDTNGGVDHKEGKKKESLAKGNKGSKCEHKPKEGRKRG